MYNLDEILKDLEEHRLNKLKVVVDKSGSIKGNEIIIATIPREELEPFPFRPYVIGNAVPEKLVKIIVVDSELMKERMEYILSTIQFLNDANNAK